MNKKLFEKLKKYISINYITEENFEQTAASLDFTQMFQSELETEVSKIFTNKTKTFSEVLLDLIKYKKIDEVECYKNARVDRRIFSKIRCDKFYKPSMETVVKFIIALHLNIDEADSLLSFAGFRFSDWSLFDVIIQFCIKNKIYDTFVIDEALELYNLPPIFSK